MDRDTHIDHLIAKFEDGTISEEEYRVLLGWYNSFDDSKAVVSPVEPDSTDQLKARMREQLFDLIHAEKTPPKLLVKVRKWLPYVAAAVLMLALTFGWLLQDKIMGLSDSRVGQSERVLDVLPGSNRATLTLADGQIVDLKEEETGIVVGDELSYADGSTVFDSKENALENPYYVLATPRGGTYKISLPDGTNVWLNAASRLKYPARFSDDERVVEISGEAYFSVTPDEHRPFKVVAEAQTINVLGTEFNIAAYEDEKEIRTTLIAGSVSVAASAEHQSPVVLQPGQQANLSNSVVDVQEVNTAPYVAWKDGLFYFEDTPFDIMMRQIARWYDVDVFYKGEIPKDSFSGKLRRSVTLAGVLQMLRTSDIDVVLKENTIVIN